MAVGSQCTWLRNVNIFNTNVTDDGLVGLSESSRLNRLNISNCHKVTDQGVLNIVDGCPIVVLVAYGCANMQDDLEYFQNILRRSFEQNWTPESWRALCNEERQKSREKRRAAWETNQARLWAGGRSDPEDFKPHPPWFWPESETASEIENPESETDSETDSDTGSDMDTRRGSNRSTGSFSRSVRLRL